MIPRSHLSCQLVAFDRDFLLALTELPAYKPSSRQGQNLGPILGLVFPMPKEGVVGHQET